MIAPGLCAFNADKRGNTQATEADVTSGSTTKIWQCKGLSNTQEGWFQGGVGSEQAALQCA